MNIEESQQIADGLGKCLPLSYIINNIYASLLADISELSGVSLHGFPGDIPCEWVLIEGPKLDKQLLQFIEGTGQKPVFPEWVSPLFELFLQSPSEEVEAMYLRWIRQLLVFCYKIENAPTNEQLIEAQKAFEDTDAGVATWETSFEARSRDPLFASARQIVGRVIYKIDWSVIVPQHGPGAVYPPVNHHARGNFDSICTTIEPHYPFYGNFCLLPTLWENRAAASRDLKDVSTIECSLVAVPKDSRGPRLICVHPAYAIWIQQGCRRLLERAIMDAKSPCHGRITFDDQETNGRLALSSSKDRKYCTLDLKEASDRISPKLVEYLFGTYAYEKLSCARASKVKLLDNRVIELRKWAPMGNCLTFPVQSLLFYSLVRSGIRCRYGVICDDVYVFGDDIIFPSVYYDGALNALIRAGLIPNTSKTFRHGFFRESCGVDAFKGFDVTPHRLKRIDSSTNTGAMSLCALAKAMRISGYHLASEAIYRAVEIQYGKLHENNNPAGQGIYRYTPTFTSLLKYERSLRFNGDLQKWQTRALLVEGETYLPLKDDWNHLQESLLRLHLMMPVSGLPCHRDRTEIPMDRSIYAVSQEGLVYGVPHSTRLKRGWIDVV